MCPAADCQVRCSSSASSSAANSARAAVVRGAAGGELAQRGQLGPGDPGLQPSRGGDDPDQLVIGQPGQALTVLAGQGVHHGGQQRPRLHGIGFAVLGEPLHVQVLGRQAHEQALLRARPGVRVITGPLATRAGGRHRAVGLLAVEGWAEEGVLGHAPPSWFGRNWGERLCEHYSILPREMRYYSEIFFNNLTRWWAGGRWSGWPEGQEGQRRREASVPLTRGKRHNGAGYQG